MNEQNLPPDELASAFLDDELDEGSADAVRRDPESAARVDELRRASDAVGASITPPPGAEDAAVEAALADFDARRTTALEPTRQRSRRLSLITGVAAAVAIGFIVAAAVGLLTEQEDADQETTSVAAAPPPAAAPEAPPAPAADEAAAAPPPPAEPAPADAEAMGAIQAAEATAAEALEVADAAQATADLAQATAEGNEAAVAAAEAALAEAQAAEESARLEAAAAQAEADEAREAAAAAQSESAAAESEPAPPAAAPPPAAEAPPPALAEEIAGPETLPADGGDLAADDMGPPSDVDTGPAPDHCAVAVGDGAVELRITAGDIPVLIIRTPEPRIVALHGTTCEQIPPTEPADAAPNDCADAGVVGRFEASFAAGDIPVLIVRSPVGGIVALDGTTCEQIPPTEPG